MSGQLRVHDELWYLYLMTGLTGPFSGLSFAFQTLDGGPWPLWLLAALGGLLLTFSTGVLVSVRRRLCQATPARSWTRPA